MRFNGAALYIALSDANSKSNEVESYNIRLHAHHLLLTCGNTCRCCESGWMRMCRTKEAANLDTNWLHVYNTQISTMKYFTWKYLITWR